MAKKTSIAGNSRSRRRRPDSLPIPRSAGLGIYTSAPPPPDIPPLPPIGFRGDISPPPPDIPPPPPIKPSPVSRRESRPIPLSVEEDSDIPPPPPIKRVPSQLKFSDHLVGMSSGPAFPRTRPTRGIGPAALPIRQSEQFGWLPDGPDFRDHLYSAPLAVTLPSRFDLREYFEVPRPYNQGRLGSCTANALAAVVQFERMRQGLPRSRAKPSRLFIYFNERSISGTVESDSGAQLRDGIKSIASQGVCFEGPGKEDWPYKIDAYRQQPRAACYRTALRDRAVSYSRLTLAVEQMKSCLASGYPFIVGISVYESIRAQRVRKTGEIPVPATGERLIGGHTLVVVGFDDIQQRFVAQNSWGSGWGKDGYGSIPYAYLQNPDLTGDAWTIRLMSNPKPPKN